MVVEGADQPGQISLDEVYRERRFVRPQAAPGEPLAKPNDAPKSEEGPRPATSALEKRRQRDSAPVE